MTNPLAGQSPPQVALSGVVFGQYLYQLKDSVGAGHQNQFSIQRAYLNVLGRFGGGIQTRLTTDLAPAGTGNQQIRLKYAYLAWTPANSGLTYKFGMIQLPYVDWEEALWDYRMQGTVAVDRNGYMSSADVGAGIDGRWNSEQVNAQLAVFNGEGYSGGTGDSHKDAGVRVSVRLSPTNDASRVGGLRITGYGGIGKATGGADRNRLLGILSYKTQQITLAGEFVATRDSAITGSILSGFGVYRFPGNKLAAIGRVDVLDPDTDTSGNRQTRVIAGVSYQAQSNIRVLADVDLLSFQGGATPLQDATRQRALLQMQFVF
ncbi:MAG TPA: porin [Gemmatimonadales bacterium]|nr:porin [Gemmatimonadales bacterium]